MPGPPPTTAAVEALWCGARNGGVSTSGCSCESSPGDRVDARDLERALGVERRQDAREPPREHRLPRSRRPAEQQVVRARGSDLECTARALVPAHVGEVGRRDRSHDRRRLELVRLLLAAQIGDRVGEMAERQRLDARERRLCRRVRRAEQPLDPHPARSFGDGENAADPPQPAVERDLTDGRVAVELRVRQLPRRGEYRERDGQVVARPFLAEPGGREIDRDSAPREAQLGRIDAAAHALRASAHARSGRPTIMNAGSRSRRRRPRPRPGAARGRRGHG